MTTGSGPPQGLDLGTDTVALVAPPPTQQDPGGQGEDFGKSSPVGLLVVLLFFVAVAFLVRSMSKHLKRVPASFDPESAAPAAPEAEPAPPAKESSSDGGAAPER
ncbi:hypothetical protein [Actinophytocola sp.]|jgi:Na+-transporting methylmalonyl-CoA/oxaloacetate decarboxylase gamma subunit|uniref:hypothetical protein n=1 Tax=Actinophytocola sp. TaxID=1872138 RepID=UPI002ED81D67